jgi:hypothetical protein
MCSYLAKRPDNQECHGLRMSLGFQLSTKTGLFVPKYELEVPVEYENKPFCSQVRTWDAG